MGKGRIIESDSGTVKYEFLDYANHSLCGAGRDYTLGLYEDMPLSVLYDPDDPSLNMPVVGLQFHRQHEARTATAILKPARTRPGRRVQHPAHQGGRLPQ